MKRQAAVLADPGGVAVGSNWPGCSINHTVTPAMATPSSQGTNRA